MEKIKRSFLLFIFAFILILFSIFSLSFVSAGTLRVTEEHPFLINGTWIPMHELKVGDIMQTVDGKQVRIKNITHFVSSVPFPVYNLEAKQYSNFAVDGGDNLSVVVHNSKAPLSSSPKLNKVQLSSSKIEDFYRNAKSLDDLAKLPNSAVLKVEGNFNVVYIINVKKLSGGINDLPAFLRPYATGKQGLVVKFLNPREGVTEASIARYDLEKALKAENLINSKLQASGEEAFFPEKVYAWGQDNVDAVVIQNSIPELTVAETKTALLGSTDIRAQELSARLSSEIRNEGSKLANLFKSEGIVFQDVHNAQIGVGYKYNGLKLSQSQVLEGKMPISQVKIYLRAYEIGPESLKINPTGQGAFVYQHILWN